MVYSFI